MIKYFFIVFLISNIAIAKNSKWQKHYKLVLSDIKSVEALKTRDLSLRVRLFELYGEKLNLLIERENDFRLGRQFKNTQKNINAVVSRQKVALKKLESIAVKIERQTKESKILAKINYYRALNYYLVKKYDKFYIYIKRAEKFNKDKVMSVLINTKLADYHFNEKQYKQSKYYYTKLLKQNNSRWKTKYHYNLAWSHLKLKEFTPALENLKKAFYLDKKKGYFKLGKQLNDAILLFYAFSQRTSEGLNFIKKNRLLNFDNLLTYTHYVFENGNKKHLNGVLSIFDDLTLNMDNEFVLVTKKIVIFRATKQFSRLQKEFAIFKKKITRKQAKKATNEKIKDLVTNVKSYTGYLQELIKSQGLINNAKKKIYLRYIAYNFNILKSIDPPNELEYSFYEAETYFSIDNFNRAAFVYSLGIRKYRNKKNRDNKNKFLTKSFDGLFKSLENQKKPNSKILLFSFNSYLDFYPTGAKSNTVHQRLINYYKTRGQDKNMLAALKNYNKYYPSQKKVQRDYYKEILNKYIDRKNIAALTSLKKLVDNKFLGFTAIESTKLAKIIVQIYFSKYEELAKKGEYDEAIAGFNTLYLDDKSKYSLRVDSIRKKIYYENLITKQEEVHKTLLVMLKFFNPKYKKLHSEELLFYGQNICDAGLFKECEEILSKLKKDKYISLKKPQEELLFRVRLANGESLNKLFLVANTVDRKNLIFKHLTLRDSNFEDKLFRNFYQSDKKPIIDGVVDKRFYLTFYKTLSFSKVDDFIDDISITSLRDKYLLKIKQTKELIKSLNIKLPENPKEDEITEQIFSNYGQNITKAAEIAIASINNMVKAADPNFLPFLLSRAIIKFESEVERMKKFIPVSKNADLEKAMTDEVTNFQKYFDQQLIEYRSLYYKAIRNTSENIGSKMYKDDIMTTEKDYTIPRSELWIR